MKLNEYQKRALETDLTAEGSEDQHLIPLLGLAGEVGELLSEYKKHIRDGAAHVLFPDRIREELGDILWYVAAVSQRFQIDLESVANANLEKCKGTWSPALERDSVVARFDGEYPEPERFPPSFRVRLEEIRDRDRIQVKAYLDDRQMGQPLTDNAHSDDGYRFHDIFHLGLVAGLGWSPVSRRNLGLKRRSVPTTDEVEDGGRATVIEEGITALVFAYAVERNWLLGAQRIDHDLLKMIKKMTAHLEVAACSIAEWESTILMVLPVWRQAFDNRGGFVYGDLTKRSLVFRGTEKDIDTG